MNRIPIVDPDSFFFADPVVGVFGGGCVKASDKESFFRGLAVPGFHMLDRLDCLLMFQRSSSDKKVCQY